MFDRLSGLIGSDNLNKLKNTHVLLVGVGGVGGFSLEALVRSGIGHITIIDGDTIDISNLNRQIISNNSNIGNKKVNEAVLRAKSINPNIDINYYDMFLNEANIGQLKGSFDYIIDACDDIPAKILLIKYAISNNIKIVSALGTGKRIDATSVKITRLDKTINDPLAKKLRNLLKKDGVSLKIPVVYAEGLPINNDTTISSSIFVPSVAGIYLAQYVISDIIELTK